MRWLRAVALAVPIAAPVVAAAQCAAPAPDALKLDSTASAGWLRPLPSAVGVGREFAVEATLCLKGAGPEAVRLDAWMPAHRHGMNARPSVKAVAPGRWRAEGFVFHMPGHWQFTVDVDTAAGRERLTHDIVVQ